jgi:hypothetical protein
MPIIEQFESFAADFEVAVQDDNWSRLGKYFAPNATYLNVGGPDPTVKGRDAIVAYLKRDFSENDRRFDSRMLAALTPPTVEGNRLSRRWRCTYTVAGAPDLVLEGEARYLFDGTLIKAIEEEATAESMQSYERWMRENGTKLRA